MVKKANFTHSTLINELKKYLSINTKASSSSICKQLGISQPVFSRLINQIKTELLITGSARSVQYALKKSISNLGESVPVYCVDLNGAIFTYGLLHGIFPKGYYFENSSNKQLSRFFNDLPYFLHDLRPSGFLGRLIPKLHNEYKFPTDVRLWSADTCLEYLSNFAWDTIGNFIIGDNALKLYLKNSDNKTNVVTIKNRKNKYPELAERILNFGFAGSSAAGEQPKFLTFRDNTPVIVKFSGILNDKKNQRIADLLIAENIAHSVLKKHGFLACNSFIVNAGGRVFLEIERFDRVGLKGRQGIISMFALDLEHLGQMGTWSKNAEILLKKKLITKQLYDDICKLELFGNLIGNTDMHNGNLSFFTDQEEKIKSITPCYDMLPMQYMPMYDHLSDEPVNYIDYMSGEKLKFMDEVLPVAVEFWEMVKGDTRISGEFRKISKSNLSK